MFVLFVYLSRYLFICLFLIFLIHFDDIGDKILGKSTQMTKKKYEKKNKLPLENTPTL